MLIAAHNLMVLHPIHSLPQPRAGPTIPTCLHSKPCPPPSVRRLPSTHKASHNTPTSRTVTRPTRITPRRNSRRNPLPRSNAPSPSSTGQTTPRSRGQCTSAFGIVSSVGRASVKERAVGLSARISVKIVERWIVWGGTVRNRIGRAQMRGRKGLRMGTSSEQIYVLQGVSLSISVQHIHHRLSSSSLVNNVTRLTTDTHY